MRVLIQRVRHASVDVQQADGRSETVGAIQQGLLLFIGIEKGDTSEVLERMANKVLAYRVFSDHDGKMNLSVKDIQGGVLAVSQFTLAADTRKGLRPGFSTAAAPNDAKALYHEFVTLLRSRHPDVEEGEFGADMQISLLNDGPVTFLLEIQG